MASFSVIFPAAGKSTRFSRNRRKKPFVDLKGRAIWLRSVENFINRDDVKQLIVVVAEEELEWFKEKFRPNLAFMNIEIVTGGKERADSVENALKQVRDDIDFVAVHDAARPLLSELWIDSVFETAQESGAAILAVPVSSTLKKAGQGEIIQETVSREKLWEAQTPQVFRRELLQEAFANRGDFQPTDEAQLLEKQGHPVKLVTGSPMNFKITTADDFKMAEAVLNVLPKKKTLDALHPFADEEPRLL